MSYPTNQFVTSSFILNTTVSGFASNCEFIGVVNQDYKEKIGQLNGMPTGQTISVRKPTFTPATKGITGTLAPVVQQYESIVVDYAEYWNVMKSYETADIELKTNTDITRSEFYQNAQNIASNVNNRAYDYLTYGTNYYLDTGASAITWDNITTAKAQLSNLGVMHNELNMFVSNNLYQTIAKDVAITNKNFDQPLTQLANKFCVANNYGGMNQIISSTTLAQRVQVPGTVQGLNLTFGSIVSNNGNISAVINLNSTAADGVTLEPGDILNFSGIFMCNPVTHMSTGKLLTLTVNPPSDGSDNYVLASGVFSNVNVTFGLSATGATQNITALPAGGAAVTVTSARQSTFILPPQGFTLAFVNQMDLSTLAVPDFGKSGNNPLSFNSNLFTEDGSAMKETGIIMRTMFDSDLYASQAFYRQDVLPVYKAFTGLNFAILTTPTPASVEAAALMRDAKRAEAANLRESADFVKNAAALKQMLVAAEADKAKHAKNAEEYRNELSSANSEISMLKQAIAEINKKLLSK
jgi:hypothetical protein